MPDQAEMPKDTGLLSNKAIRAWLQSHDSYLATLERDDVQVGAE